MKDRQFNECTNNRRLLVDGSGERKPLNFVQTILFTWKRSSTLRIASTGRQLLVDGLKAIPASL